MEIKIKSGDKKAKLTREFFMWKFFAKLIGIFKISMSMWMYTKESVGHCITGRRSYFSDSGVAIIAMPDQYYPGRFKVYASVIDGHNKRAVFITSIYNDRKYPYKIDRYRNKWQVTVDAHHIMVDVDRTPIFTHNLLPKLSDKVIIDKEAIIEL